MNWIKPRSAPLPSPRVFDAHGREILVDDDRAVPPGARVRVPMMIQDHQPQPESKPKDSEMTLSPYLCQVGDKIMTKTDAVKFLQDQLTAERERAERAENELQAIKASRTTQPTQPTQPAQDPVAALRDAATESAMRLRDRLRAENAAQHAGSTPSGARAKELRDAWRQPQQQSQTWR